MHKFDRELQKEILTACMTTYPDPPDFIAFLQPKIEALLMKNSQELLLANLYYLKDHGLVRFEPYCDNSPESIFQELTITASGIDFMLDDGGLSTTLDVQTIKQHREVVSVLEDLIAISAMNDEQKEQASAKLKQLPFETLKTVMQSITVAGVAALLAN